MFVYFNNTNNITNIIKIIFNSNKYHYIFLTKTKRYSFIQIDRVHHIQTSLKT